MASITRRLLLQSRQCPSRIRSSSSAKCTAQWQRPLSTTPTRYVDEDPTNNSPAAAPTAPTGQTIKGKLVDTPQEVGTGRSGRLPKVKPKRRGWSPSEDEKAARSAYREAEPNYMLEDLKNALEDLDPSIIDDAIRKGKQGIPFGHDYELGKEAEDWEIEEDDSRKVAAGFWAEGEPSLGPDEDYFADDLTSHGHAELDKHRDLREYARLIAWELPLLSQLARPFELPTAANPFRFRYTSYLGEPHPAANKVVVEFCPNDLSLTPAQVTKMIKLAGPRYNPSTSIIKMSCEKFDTQAQNKRFLGETIQALVTEAKDSKDMLEDLPFDFRHHKPKPKYFFPKEWVMTPERKAHLEAKRAETARLEDERLNNGKMVDGKTIVDTSLPFMEAEPVMVEAPGRR